MTDDQIENDEVEVTLTISRATFDRAKELASEADPRISIIGEYAGMLEVDEFLGRFIEAHLGN